MIHYRMYHCRAPKPHLSFLQPVPELEKSMRASKIKVCLTLLALGAGLVATGARALDRDDIAKFLLAPSQPFSQKTEPPAPDYARPESWAAFPGRTGNAQVVPPGNGAQNDEAHALVDVFFIHPTTYQSREHWNARWNETGETQDRLEGGVLRAQASVFNGCCRVFAPRYRQATLYSFLTREKSASEALDLAYGDILRAFDYYIKYQNNGRPFILAGHSQGSLHGQRLLDERIRGTFLQSQLVAAYLIGTSLPVPTADAEIPACTTPTQTGCVISWNSVTADADNERRLHSSPTWFKGRYEPINGQRQLCINPLTWTEDGSAPASLNIGALPGAPSGSPLLPPVKGLTGATCRNGLLIVKINGNGDGFSKRVMKGSYHVYDYNLFYMNIRKNVDQRAVGYLARHPD